MLRRQQRHGRRFTAAFGLDKPPQFAIHCPPLNSAGGTTSSYLIKETSFDMSVHRQRSGYERSALRLPQFVKTPVQAQHHKGPPVETGSCQPCATARLPLYSPRYGDVLATKYREEARSSKSQVEQGISTTNPSINLNPSFHPKHTSIQPNDNNLLPL
jgi:hypothetical protein